MKSIRISNIEKAKGYRANGIGFAKVAGIKLIVQRWGNGIHCQTFRSYENECKEQNKSGRISYANKWLSIYEHQQEYGGSEEGGWYYFTSAFLSSKRVFCYKDVNGYWKPVDKRILEAAKASTGNYGRYQYEGYSSYVIEDRKGENENLARQYYQ